MPTTATSDATISDLEPARSVERAELPEHDLLAAAPCRARNSRNARPAPGERVDRDAGEQQRDDLGAAVGRETAYTSRVASEPADEGERRRSTRAERAEAAPAEHDRRGAPSAAPDDTPTTPGSASGLPKIACMTAPATASAAPTTSPITMRGKRTTHRVDSMIGSVGAHPFGMPAARSTEPITSVGEMASCPIIDESTAPTSTSAVSARARSRPRSPGRSGHGTRCSHVLGAELLLDESLRLGVLRRR